MTEHEFATVPFEGRFRVSAEFAITPLTTEVDLQNWYQVSTDQAGAELATHLLHPEAPDSFFAWGNLIAFFSVPSTWKTMHWNLMPEKCSNKPGNGSGI